MAAVNSSKNMAYRPDIDGLRAVAVLMVALFHAEFSDWKGGYVGVDVFFVISGYLICQLLMLERERSGFQPLAFLMRRMRRLAPPVIPVILVTLAVGALFFVPHDADRLALSGVASATYWANWWFWAQSGYFDTAPHMKPLLHFWSLGVEMQFYLLFAATFALIAVSKSARRWLLSVAVSGGVASFAYAQVMFPHAEAAVFFDTFARLWELCIGVLIALAPSQSPSGKPLPPLLGPLLRGGGLALIIWAALSFDSSESGPGVAMLAPTLGAAMVIAAPAMRYDPTYHLLTNPLVVGLGLISYSFYLWHWPILSAMRFVYLELSDEIGGLGLGISLLAALVSYFLVERPTRMRRLLKDDRSLAKATVVACATVVVVAIATPHVSRAAYGYTETGALLADLSGERALRAADARVFTGRDRLDELPNFHDTGCSYDGGASTKHIIRCLIDMADDRDHRVFLIIGDSHAHDAAMTMREAFPQLRFAYLHHGGCGVFTHRSEIIGGDCYQALDEILARTLDAREIQGVIVSTQVHERRLDGRSYAFQSLRVGELFRDQRPPILMMGPSPTFRHAPDRYLTSANSARDLLVRTGRLPINELKPDFLSVRAQFRQEAEALGYAYFDRLAPFCDETSCAVVGAVDDTPERALFVDTQHLSRAGRAILARAMQANATLLRFLGLSAG